MERRLQKDFQIGIVEGIVNQVIQGDGKAPKDVFSQIAKAIGRRSSSGSKKKDWNEMVRQNTVSHDPIGSRGEQFEKQQRRSLRRRLMHQGESALESLDPARLLEYNPNLQELSDTTKVAYAKFMLRRPAPKEGAEGTRLLILNLKIELIAIVSQVKEQERPTPRRSESVRARLVSGSP